MRPIWLGLVLVSSACSAPEVVGERAAPSKPTDMAPVVVSRKRDVPAWTDADRARTESVLERARTDPAAVAELDGNPFPLAPLWRDFFGAVGYGAPPDGGAGASPAAAFQKIMDASISVEARPNAWPCWVAERWPEHWAPWVYEDPVFADNMGFMCSSPLAASSVQRGWVARMNRAVTAARGAMNHMCGRIQRAHDLEATVEMTVFWFKPSAFAVAPRPHLGGFLGGNSTLLEHAGDVLRAPVRPTTSAALIRALQPTQPWLRHVEGHLVRNHALSGREAHRQAMRLAEGLQALMLASHAACGTVAEDIADGMEVRHDLAWVPYGVAGSEITKPEGGCGLW